MTKELWRLPRVMEVTGMSRSSIEHLTRTGRFPVPIRIGDKSKAWVSTEIEAFVEKVIEEGRGKPLPFHGTHYQTIRKRQKAADAARRKLDG